MVDSLEKANERVQKYLDSSGKPVSGELNFLFLGLDAARRAVGSPDELLTRMRSAGDAKRKRRAPVFTPSSLAGEKNPIALTVGMAVSQEPHRALRRWPTVSSCCAESSACALWRIGTPAG